MRVTAGLTGHSPSGVQLRIMVLERGTIRHINGRGRVTVELADRLVVADIHSGSGGCIGDIIEGDMQPGVRSWRNVGTSVLSVVEIVASDPLPASMRHGDIEAAGPMPLRRASDFPKLRPEERWSIGRRDDPGADQYSSRKFN